LFEYFHKRPFEYSPSKKGREQLKWLEDYADEHLLDLDT